MIGIVLRLALARETRGDDVEDVVEDPDESGIVVELVFIEDVKL